MQTSASETPRFKVLRIKPIADTNEIVLRLLLSLQDFMKKVESQLSHPITVRQSKSFS
jgi:hypothetical protein